MSVQTGIDIPNDVFGGTLTEIGQSNMPAGGSPANENVEFLPGMLRTRGGLQPDTNYAGIAGGPWQVRHAKSFGVIPESQKKLALLWNPTTKTGVIAGDQTTVIGSLFGYGNVAPWNPSIVDPNFTGPLAKSVTQFSREYIGISQGRYGWDIPRQWDGKYFDRVSQCGPGAPPSVANFLPAPATIAATGGGTSVNIAAAPTGAVRSAPRTFTYTTKVWKPGPFLIDGGSGGTWITKTTTVTYDTVVTFTTTTPHGAVVGQSVVIAGCTPTDFNGTVVVLSVPTSTTLTVAQTSPTLGETGGGGTLTALSNSVQRLSNVVTVITAAAHNFQPGWTAVIAGIADLPVGGGITSISQLNGIATCKTASAHGLVPGSFVDVTGTTNFNSPSGSPYIVLTVPNTTTFTFAFTYNVTPETSGTVSSVLNGTVQIISTPTPKSLTYRNSGPNLAVTPAAGTVTIQGNISAGNHQFAVCFITRQGYITVPSPPTTLPAAGGQLAQLTNIPTGPANVVARLIIGTIFITPPAITADFYALRGSDTLSGNLFQINDNTTTAVALDFTDSQLAAGFSADYLYDLIEIGEVAAFTSYAGRIFAWGEMTWVEDFLNMEFNGGWSLGGGTGGGDLPLGWASDLLSGAGGSIVSGGGVFGDAYKITIATGEGMLTQDASNDAFGSPILEAGISYGARVTALASSLTGTVTVEFFSPSLGSLALVNLSGFGASFGTLMGAMNASLPAILPTDMVLRVYASGGTGTVTIDRVSLYPVNNSINTTVVRASRFQDPESFDGVLGLLQPIYANGEAVRSVIPLRDSLYIVCDRSLYVTKDTGGEPATWTIDPVSSSVGCCGPHAVGIGEDWIVKANRYGLYIYLGREPQKISHEIQTLWDQINWSASGKLWVTVDPALRRVYIGAPVNGSVEVNQIFVMSYETLDTSDMIAQYGTLRFSPYTGRRLILEQGRKWTIWNFQTSAGATLTTPYGALVEQSDGTAQFLLGGNVDSNLYFIDTTKRGNDNGAAVTSSYTIHFFPTSDEEQQFQLRSHMHGFSFSRWYVSGSGNMDVYLYANNLLDTDPKRMRVRMANPPEFDHEMTIDKSTAERWSMKFESTELDSWFQVERMTRTVEMDKNNLFRGTNYE